MQTVSFEAFTAAVLAMFPDAVIDVQEGEVIIATGFRVSDDPGILEVIPEDKV